MFEHLQWNFIIFGRQKLTTLKDRFIRPNFDTIIKKNKSTYKKYIMAIIFAILLKR